jgi:hypothetical protein
MQHLVRRTTFVPFRPFWGDVRREFMQQGLGSTIDASSIVSSSPGDSAIDVIGCDIDIDTMAVVLASMPSIIKTIVKY